VTPGLRTILHVDMDAFYASVEQRDDPRLRGKPVVVGGGSNRGVVAAASYEAREYGIRSAMPMREACRRCPDLLRIPMRMSHYKAVSNEVFAILREYTPLVEGLSLDEAYLDVSASLTLFGDAVAIAQGIKSRIAAQTRLAASVGVAPNKLVAKIASDLDKPDGLVVIAQDDVGRILDPLPVQVIPGIGQETLRRLRRAGVSTIAQLRLAPDRDLEPVFGRYAGRVRERASGVDEAPVVPSRAEKSISSEETYDCDLSEPAEMVRQLLRLSERTAARLREKGLVAGTVTVKIRRSDFSTYTRQRMLHPPGNNTEQLFESAKDLLARWRLAFPGARVRLLGVGGSNLAPAAQADLFSSDAPSRDGINRTADAIRSRFGDGALGRARVLGSGRIR
jgi:DNA polymerase IV